MAIRCLNTSGRRFPGFNIVLVFNKLAYKQITLCSFSRSGAEALIVTLFFHEFINFRK